MADTEVGGLVVKMRGDLTDYLQKLNQMEQQLTSTSGKVVVALGGFSATSSNSAMNWAMSVKYLANTIGMASEEFFKFLAVAKHVGIEVDTTRMAFAKFSRNIMESAQAQYAASAKGEQMPRTGIFIVMLQHCKKFFPSIAPNCCKVKTATD